MTRMSQRKRAKVNDGAGRTQQRTKLAIRKTGGLSQLVNMPMDILMEVRIPFFLPDLVHISIHPSP
jgi:hypothetical protein